MRRLLFLPLLLVGSLSLAQTQPKTTLADFLAKTPYDPASGVRIVLDPGKVRAIKGPVSLADFDRKEVKVGSLHAIVPTTMVLIDDSLKQQANLYDGLPRDAKILYLMTLLNDGQWRKAATQGIGLADLSGEARLVFLSLLPNPFQVSQREVKPNGEYGGAKRIEFTDKEREGVRLQISLAVSIQVKMTEENGIMQFEAQAVDHPGETVWERDDSDDFDKTETFGVKVRQKVENKTKPSDLAYSNTGWDAQVKLASPITIEDALNKIGVATGQSFTADPRVGNRSLQINGASARAGDLLQAIALTVTGTYRKVGSIYHLTSDVAGLGSRKLKLSIWESALQQEAWRRSSEWRKAIGKMQGRLGQLSYPTDLGLAPTAKMKEAMAKEGQTWFPDSSISDEHREFLDSMAKMYKYQPFSRNEYSANSFVQFRFVLPNNQMLRPERLGLGDMRMFQPFEAAPHEEPKINLPIKVGENGIQAAILLSAATPDEVRSKIELAKSAGFGDFWIRTEREDVIQEAIKAADGKPVHLVIAPFAADLSGQKPPDPDLNLIGESKLVAEKRLSLVPSKIAVYGHVEFGNIDILLSPTDPALPTRLNKLAGLAKTEGLQGVALVGIQPPGYQKMRSGAMYGGYTPQIGEQRNLGYSLSMRQEFLQKFHIDPIDIVPDGLRLSADLRQPFFLDDRLRGGNSVYDGRNIPDPSVDAAYSAWDEFRYQKNTEAMLGFVKRFDQETTLLELGDDALNIAPSFQILRKGRLDMRLPTISAEQKMQGDGNPESVLLIPVGLEPPTQTLEAILSYAVNGKARLILDFSAIPADKLEKALGMCFRKGPQ